MQTVLQPSRLGMPAGLRQPAPCSYRVPVAVAVTNCFVSSLLSLACTVMIDAISLFQPHMRTSVFLDSILHLLSEF